MMGLAMLAAASSIATFRCTFDDPPTDVAAQSAPVQAAWAATKGAAPFKVSFPTAQPDDLQKAELFAYRDDDLTGYAVETGLPGPLQTAHGPTEVRRIFWPGQLRQTLEDGSDHWLWVELTGVDLENGTAGLNLYRMERPALIKPTWQVTGQCVDANREPASADKSEGDTAQ